MAYELFEEVKGQILFQYFREQARISNDLTARLRLTFSEVFSKGLVDCIARKAQVGIVIPDLEVEPQQPETFFSIHTLHAA